MRKPRATAVNTRALQTSHLSSALTDRAAEQGVSPALAEEARDFAASTQACRAAGAYGVCEGQVAKACVANKLVENDCAQAQMRCVMTREGARCLEDQGPLSCGVNDVATCQGDKLRVCLDGLWVSHDCALLRGRCAERGDGAQCELPSAVAAPARNTELCDQRDNDADQRIDEGGACDAVRLVPFVPKGAVLTDLDARMQRELVIVNRIYAPLSFEWAKPLEVNEVLRHVPPGDMDVVAPVLASLASSHGNHTLPEGGYDFYIPILFAEALVGEPPKSGVSTLPNERCGGVRLTDHAVDPAGLVVLADARTDQTLAHELGHYLGLCHTHDDVSAFASSEGEYCERAGDSVCDTPDDPGPGVCSYDEACAAQCADGQSTPDTTNVMSYYTECRTGLSAEQQAEVARGLSLRRGWFQCLNAADCPCDPMEEGTCPEDMSCQPASGRPVSGLAGRWYCALDGIALPGAPCEAGAPCSGGAICMRSDSAAASTKAGQCIRPCTASAQCTCMDAGLPFPVCREDVGRER